LTETPRSFAALPVLIVLSMNIIIHYRVLYGKLESGSVAGRLEPDAIRFCLRLPLCAYRS